MNRAELIDEIAKGTGLTKKESSAALEAITGAITKALEKGDRVALTGFGSFSVKNRAARTGINPQTREKINIKATKVVKFSPGKALKDAVK